MSFLIVPSDGGAPRELIRGTELGYANFSPDGRYVAIPSSDPSTKSKKVMLVSVDSGETRELLACQNPIQKLGIETRV